MFKNIFKRRLILKSSFIIAFILVLLGLLMVSFGCVNYIKNTINDKYYVKSLGVVSKIIDNENERTIYIKYNYEGVEYEEALKYFNAELDLENTVSIKINSKNPHEFKMSKSLSTFSLLFVLGVGILILIYNLITLIKVLKLNIKINNIIKNGKCISLKIISVEENDKDINLDVSPKLIECITMDGLPIQSHNIYTRKDFYGYVNRYVNVYFIGEKPNILDKNYYIDFESVSELSDSTNNNISKFEE